MLTEAREQPHTAVLIGFESSGKSALFRGLTGEETGEEANFRGSTIRSRKGRLTDGLELADLPGIRVQDDSRTTQEALDSVTHADIVVLVVRATHASVELPLLLKALNLDSKKALLVLTFADKQPNRLPESARYYGKWLGIPVMTADARRLKAAERTEILLSFTKAQPLRSGAKRMPARHLSVVHPKATWFEHPVWGRPLALAATCLLFAGTGRAGLSVVGMAAAPSGSNRYRSGQTLV
ncbi:FeoB small GTPase domain-containing protein [Paenibacillus sp. TAB 01]|uniref:FeoB small GTPase domain-containing protein n=1 Tax=Paenibacillus sp. TAB 01 TaxID=3368988 RepID=UPI003751CA84